LVYDVIIIGSGPAGLTAAIYTSRAFLKTLVLTGLEKGGQLTTTTSVDNFPGFPEGIQGPELMQKMEEQAVKFGTEIVPEEATSVILSAAKDLPSDKKQFTVNSKYQSRSLIIASGASHKHLGLPEEKDFIGKGVSYCATCDAFFFRGKTVAVIGGGDTAMEEASFISKFASKVYLIHRRAEFKASKIMFDKVKNNPKIEIIINRTVKQLLNSNNIVGDDLLVVPQTDKPGGLSLQKIILESTIGEPDQELSVDGLFVAIGLRPNTDFLKGIVNLDEKGYIIKSSNIRKNPLEIRKNPNGNISEKQQGQTNYKNMTSVEGIFVAGDVADPIYRQAITAAGDGCAAALEVEKWLNNN
jgi:thioredoxin reductase (NADPH)